MESLECMLRLCTVCTNMEHIKNVLVKNIFPEGEPQDELHARCKL